MRMIARSYAAILEQLNGEVEAMMGHVAVAIQLSDRYGFAYYREWHKILQAGRNGQSHPIARRELNAPSTIYARSAAWRGGRTTCRCSRTPTRPRGGLRERGPC